MNNDNRVTPRSVPAILSTMGSIADIDRETANATRAFIEKVASRYDLAGAILFGSRARKSHRADSDADVAVLLHGRPGKFVATKLAMADLAYDVLLETGIRIQPLPIWEDEWEHPEAYSNPRLLHNISREGIRFLGRRSFWRISPKFFTLSPGHGYNQQLIGWLGECFHDLSRHHQHRAGQTQRYTLHSRDALHSLCCTRLPCIGD